MECKYAEAKAIAVYQQEILISVSENLKHIEDAMFSEFQQAIKTRDSEKATHGVTNAEYYNAKAKDLASQIFGLYEAQKLVCVMLDDLKKADKVYR